jgi:hypothetical protein
MKEYETSCTFCTFVKSLKKCKIFNITKLSGVLEKKIMFILPQKFPAFYGIRSVIYFDHKSPPVVPTLSQINTLCNISSSLISITILFYHPHRGLPSAHFLQVSFLPNY